MRFLSIIVAVVAITLPAAPSIADDVSAHAEIEAAKNKLNAAFKNHDLATIESMITPDHLAASTYYGGGLGPAEELAVLSEFDVTDAVFSPSTIKLLAPTVALVTYENTYEGTFAGEPLPDRVFVSEIWLKQDGAWLQQLYQETPIPAK